jgi:hypothetical protein
VVLVVVEIGINDEIGIHPFCDIDFLHIVVVGIRPCPVATKTFAVFFRMDNLVGIIILRCHLEVDEQDKHHKNR